MAWSWLLDDLPMSMPIFSHRTASSLMSETLTSLKVFSSSLAISAARHELTGYTWGTTRAYNVLARSVEAGSKPPTTLGVFSVL